MSFLTDDNGDGDDDDNNGDGDEDRRAGWTCEFLGELLSK